MQSPENPKESQKASSPQLITLAPLTALDTESQLKIRDIRNEPGVRRWMFTDQVIGINEHLAWINRLKTDDSRIVFAVLNQAREPLGLASVNAIDRRHKRADWGFFLTRAARGSLWPAVEFSLIDFVFEALGMEKLNSEVVAGNAAVVKLHLKFLFQQEGFRRSNLTKNGERLGVHMLGLTRPEWALGRQGVFDKHHSTLRRFSVSIEWQAPSVGGKTDPIDQIERARARNNLNWMSILRLAIEKSPAAATPIVADIRKIDREIASLTDELTASDEGG